MGKTEDDRGEDERRPGRRVEEGRRESYLFLLLSSDPLLGFVDCGFVRCGAGGGCERRGGSGVVSIEENGVYGDEIEV